MEVEALHDIPEIDVDVELDIQVPDIENYETGPRE